jgi:hypothetical protein
MEQPELATVFCVHVTAEMIRAGVVVLVEEFGGSAANPATDFGRTAQNVFESMIALCEPENLVYRVRE